MNWTIKLNKTAQFINTTAQGEFTLRDCRAMRKDLLSRHYWRPGMNILIDFRRASFTNMKLDILRAAAESHKLCNPRIGNGKIALLMRSPHDFGLARQYEMVSEGKILSQIYVFLDEHRAHEWLTSISIFV